MPKDSPRIAAVVLAAGMSRRMGAPKALLDLGGQPLITRLLDSVRAVSEIRQVIVVTGHQPELIHQAAREDRTRFVHNSNYESGEMLSSIQTGLGAIQAPCDAFFILLLDQPLVRPTTLSTQIHAWRKDRPTLVIPTYHGKRGHPLLLDARSLGAISALSAGGSLRDFVKAQSSDRICLIKSDDDPGVITDIDTPADYQGLLELWTQQNRPIH